MARPMTFEGACRSFYDPIAAVLSPAGAERFKLDRLLELRAVIDSVRRERESELLIDVRAEVIRHS